MNIYYTHAVHTMQDGTLTTTCKVYESDLGWSDFLMGPAKDRIRWIFAQPVGDAMITFHVHTEAQRLGEDLVPLTKTFQPAEILRIIEDA